MTGKIFKTQEQVPPFMQRYLDQVPEDGNLLLHLEDIFEDTEELVARLTQKELETPYEAGKWTIKDALVHLIDTERIFCYRALRFSRGDETPLPGFEQELFAQFAGANLRAIDDIIKEYRLVRQASIAFIESLTPEALQRKGTASGNLISVQLLANLIYGHHKHHINIIHEKYLKDRP